MTTRIATSAAPNGVTRTLTAPRVTPPPARPIRAVMDASADAVHSGAESAAVRLPGGPILAAAFRSAPVAAGAAGTTGSPEGTAGTSGGLVLAAGSASAQPADLTTAAGPALAPGVEGALTTGSDRTLQYLELQERISSESNAYTALSNVLKARHDTIKNAIGNIR